MCVCVTGNIYWVRVNWRLNKMEDHTVKYSKFLSLKIIKQINKVSKKSCNKEMFKFEILQSLPHYYLARL